MNIYNDLFLTFSRIGMFTVGGGYVMLPLIEDAVVNKKHWLSHEDFLESLTIAQSLPGVFAINLSIYIGHKLKGKKGSLVAASAVALPSFLIILLIAIFFHNIKDNETIESIFKGLRPAVAALILGSTFRIAQKSNLNYKTGIIAILIAILIWQFGVSPINIIFIVCFSTYIYTKINLVKKTINKK